MPRITQGIHNYTWGRLKLCFCALLLIGATPTSAADPDPGRVIVILDGSNSMWGHINGVEKITIARETLSEALGDLRQGTQIGLAAYGHRSTSSCNDIEVLLPVGTNSQDQIEAAIRSVRPKGMTPISAALEYVVEEVDATNRFTHLVLVSDGKETCGRNPCDLVSKLSAENVDLSVHVVGFDVTEEESKQLKCIAREGRGLYAGAGDADELAAALVRINSTVLDLDSAPSRSVDSGEPRTRPDTLHAASPYWEIVTSRGDYKGEIVILNQESAQISIHMVNDEAVNLHVTLVDHGEDEAPFEGVSFAVDRGERCRLLTTDPMATIKLESVEAGWVDGVFSAALGCPDYTEITVNGYFHIQDWRNKN